jgi:hypothetical protein
VNDAADDEPQRAYPRSALYGSGGIDWDRGGFTILTATRLSQREAERIALEYVERGYRTGIRVDDDDRGSTAYRVIVGQFETLRAATAALNAVRRDGIRGIIVDVNG